MFVQEAGRQFWSGAGSLFRHAMFLNGFPNGSQALKLCQKYSPETREAKNNRLMEAAQQKKDGQESKMKKPQVLKYGLKHVTT